MTLVGFVFGVWLAVRWVLLAQVIALEEPTRHPLRRTATVARGSWWRIASVTVLVAGTALLIGPVIGCLLLFATSTSFNVINLVSGIVYVVVLPLAAIIQTYLYFDVRVKKQLAPAKARAEAVLPAEI